MKSKKSMVRNFKSASDSGGDRRAGSVGERPELIGSRDNDNRSRTAARRRGGEEDVIEKPADETSELAE